MYYYGYQMEEEKAYGSQGDRRHTQKVLECNSEGNSTFGILEIDGKIILKKAIKNWFDVAQDRDE